MTATICTILICTIFYLAAYAAGRDNPLMNLVSALGIVIVITGLLPELRYLPIPAYLGVWALAFVGLQYILPVAEGGAFGFKIQTRYVFVAVGVAG